MPDAATPKPGPQARRARPWLLAAGALAALLVACVWLLPGMLDWNQYRDGIAALAAQRLGRPVHIGGAVTLHLLPQPILTASDVTVDDAGDGIGLRARALRLRVGLGPLLGGNVDARELTLQGPEMRLPWPLPAGALAQRPPAWVTGLQARIEDGRLQVGDIVFSNVDATFSTDPDTGTLSAAGVGQSNERMWQFTARLARPGRDGAAGLDVSLDGQGPLRDTGGTFSGTVGPDGTLAGRVAGRGPDLSALMPAPAVPWRGDGRLNASGGLAVADELALEIGGAPARGAVALRVAPTARLDLAVAAGRLDLDAWLPALLARNPDALRAGVPTGIDLSAEAASLAGGTVRRLRAAIDLEPSGIQLREVAALLPGDAVFTLSGEVAVQPGGPRFDGAVKITAPDLRATLRWAQRALPPWAASIPPGVLRSADASAQVAAAAGQWAVSELQGTIDGAPISGAVSMRSGPRPALTAGLAAGRLDLAAWLPGPALPSADAALAAVASLRAMDIDLRLRAADTRWGAVPLGAAALELQSDAARVFLRRLEAQPLGMRLTAAGQLAEAGRLTDARLELSAPDLAALAPLAANLPPDWERLAVLLRGPGSAAVQASGTPDALAGRVVLEVGDLRIEAKPTVNLPARRWTGALTLHHPGAPRLLETLGLGATASWLGDGSLSLVGIATAAPGRTELDGATLAAGSLRLAGRLALEGTRVTGQLSAETLPVPLPYPRSPDPLPVTWLRGWQAAVRLEAAQVLAGLTPVLQSASGDVTLEAGVLRIARATARVAGGTLSGAATLDAAQEPPRLELRGQATGIALGSTLDTPLDVAAGQLAATVDLAAAGFSPAALLATVQGTIAIRIRDGVLAGLDLPAATAALTLPDNREATEAIRTALLGGTTPFTTLALDMALSRGVGTLTAAMQAPSGDGKLTGSWDMLGASLDARADLRPRTETPPTLALRLSGPADTPTRTPELAPLARWLADRTPATP